MDDNQRAIPDGYRPVIEQSLINLASKGCKVVDENGADLTAILIEHAPSINDDYDKWLEDMRNGHKIAS
jgi:hypothetical protein